MAKHSNGPVFKAWRVEQGLSVEGAAKRCNIGQQGIKDFEAGWRPFSLWASPRVHRETGLPLAILNPAAARMRKEYEALRGGES